MPTLMNDSGAATSRECFAYPMNLRDGHVLVESNGMILLMDTGAPTSVGTEEFLFAGSTVTPAPNFEGVTIGSLSREVGTSLDALVGMDIMADLDLCFDEPNNQITVTRDEMELSDDALPLHFNCGIPLVDGSLASGRRVSLVFDTGAKISYLKREFLAGAEPHRTVEDFHPGYGRFATPLCRTSLELAGATHEVDFGILPDRLEQALLSCLADGIVGSELLVDREVVLASRRGRLSMSDR